MDPKYPDVTVPLTGEDGNIFFILGRARRAAKRAGVSAEEIEAFTTEIHTTPSYDEALQTVMRWFDTE